MDQLLNPDYPSIYLLATRNPEVSKDDATLESYLLLKREPDNLKYMFILPINQPKDQDEDEITYQLKQFVNGLNIYDSAQLASFISTYLNTVTKSTLTNQPDGIDLSKLENELYMFHTFDEAAAEKELLEKLQNSYHISLIESAQSAIQPIEIEVVDLVMLISEFTQRVIMPEVLKDPDRLDDLRDALKHVSAIDQVTSTPDNVVSMNNYKKDNNGSGEPK